MPPGAGGEIQLTDGIARLLGEERVVAYRFEGRRYDCGSKLGYLEATVDFGLKHPETGRRLRALPARSGDTSTAMTLNELRYIVAVAQRAQLRPRRAAMLREPARAVGRDPEARGGARRAGCSSAARARSR